MTLKPHSEQDKSQPNSSNDDTETENEKILCPHCKRTATNGIKCKGICVADDDY
ncbi:MAG: hypothetical protein KI793_10565 [Rivularia sp. (in: Bacteria)]|nr:hypothetical protein [Rivularia sp. MS3]